MVNIPNVQSMYVGNKRVLKVYIGNSPIPVKLFRLATPINVKLSNQNELSFDSVDNAQKYEIFVDDTISLGEIQIQEYVYTFQNNILRIDDAPYTFENGVLTIL